MVYVIENHPADSRVTLCKDNIVQTLSSRMGTGGGNVPLLLYPKVTGALCANSHPGSYTGQDAYNDMLPVIEEESCITSTNNESANMGRGGSLVH